MHKAKAVTPITDLAVLQQQLAAIQASSSWRITSPLRFLARAAKRLLGKSAASSSPPALVLNDYSEWIRQFDSLSNEVSANFLAQIDTFSHLPLFSILLPIQNAALEDVCRAVASVQQQIYTNWELCITVGAGTSAEVQNFLRTCALAEPRIKLATSVATDIAQLSNQSLAMVGSQSEWVVRLDAIFSIAVQAIFVIARSINSLKNSQIIYSDEDLMDMRGQRSEPDFKPDWNLDLHLSRNLIGHSGIYRTAVKGKRR